MKRMAMLACYAASQFCLAGASCAEWFRPLDRGGRIGDYVERVIAAAGQRHEIRGDCMSACTIWLGHKGSCVAPDAVLWFHAATDSLRAMHDDNPWRSISERGAAALLAWYPPRVKAVVRPWLNSPEFRTLSGEELIRLGVPACN